MKISSSVFGSLFVLLGFVVAHATPCESGATHNKENKWCEVPKLQNECAPGYYPSTFVDPNKCFQCESGTKWSSAPAYKCM